MTIQMEGWSKGAVPAVATQRMAIPQPEPVAYAPITQTAPPMSIPAAPPQPLTSYQPPVQPVAPYTPPMQASTAYTPPMGSPPPRTVAPAAPPQPTPIDDDPFGGTADFDPIND